MKLIEKLGDGLPAGESRRFLFRDMGWSLKTWILLRKCAGMFIGGLRVDLLEGGRYGGIKITRAAAPPEGGTPADRPAHG